MMSKEKRRVPKLRFPGFTEDWEQCKFGDLYEKISEKNDLSYSLDKIISVANMYYKSDAKVSNEEYLKTYNIFRYGEIAFEGNKSKDFAYGRFVENTIGDGIISHVFEVFRPIVKYDIYFWKYYINYEPIMGKVLSRCTKKTTMMTNLVAKDFLKETVLVPTLAEQKQIGILLNTLDKFITLHQRKLDNLKLKKKALLQKLFPKNGERYPELRFPGFTDAWEQRKLGDFTNQINTFVNPEDAKLPLWSLTAEAGLIEKSDRYERDFLVKKKDQFKRIETNTLVYNPMNITIGSIDIYTGLYPIAVSGYYVSIVYNKNIDTDFLKEALLLPSSLKMYKNYATGSLIERQRVQYPTFSKLQLLFPNLDEQKAIGQLFKSLNLNITLHQRKLDHLKLQKKALLQQMFV